MTHDAEWNIAEARRLNAESLGYLRRAKIANVAAMVLIAIAFAITFLK